MCPKDYEIRATALSRKQSDSLLKGMEKSVCQTDLASWETLHVPEIHLQQVTKAHLPNYQTLCICVDTNDTVRSTPEQIDEKLFCQHS